MKVTVVICTRRRPVLLTRCLAAVTRLHPAPTQVIVVDNSQGDAETEKVAREFGVRYTLEPKAGLSHARKRGLAECKTDSVAFLDDDAIPQPEWLDTLAASSACKKSTGSKEKVLSIESRGSKVHRKSPRKFGKKAEE